MAQLHLLIHSHAIGDSIDTKVLGVYSSQALSDAAMSELRLQPGFRDEPFGFSSFEMEVDTYRGDSYERVLLSD